MWLYPSERQNRPRVLSALAKFGTNFNQAQIHVRGEKQSRTTAGYQYEDGSYNTPIIRFNLKEPLSRKEIQKVIDSSGLNGLTVTDQYLETYFVGDPTNAEESDEFIEATERARKSLGRSIQNTRREVSRLWAYGRDSDITDSRLLYANIHGRFRPPSGDRASASALLRVASRLANRLFQPTQQALTITPEKQRLQRRIADEYDALRADGLGDPIVRYSYEQLAQELLPQFDALPIKIEVWEGKGEPYGGKRMSAKMREDVLFNNHLYIYGTDVGTFGPPGATYDNHPLLADSGRADMNGRPLLYNDLLRAVHDYYAHTMSPATFGQRGEEAAWRNHMLMTDNPWARWALTSETRGQNSWVNAREGAAGLSLRERGFSEQKVDLLPLEFVMINDATVDASLAELPGSEGLSLPSPQGEAVIQEEEAGPSMRFSLAEDRMLDRLDRRAANRRNQEKRAAHNAALEKQGVFTGFSNVDKDAFVPVKMFNGGVTNVPIDGKFYPVVMTIGHDQWSDAKNKYVGWGMKHAARHLDDIVQNTNYNSVDDFISGILNMYHANRVLGPKALKQANFEVFEVGSWTDDIRGPKIVMRWWYDQWSVPGTLVLQKIDFSAEEKTNPKLRGNSFASVITAYALPSTKGKLEPRKSQIINPAASLTAKKAAYTAKAKRIN